MRRVLLPTLVVGLALMLFRVPRERGGLHAQSEHSVEAVERHTFIDRAMHPQLDLIADDGPTRGQRTLPQFVDTLTVRTTLVPFGDWDYYYVQAQVRGGREIYSGPGITWTPNQLDPETKVEVPVGFVTDLTSVPRGFWTALRPEGRYAYAAVVHDYLYWTQTRSREEADQILKIAMEDSDVETAQKEAIYRSVRVFGEFAWNEDRRLKQRGERRLLKKFPTDFRTPWEVWKRQPDVFAD